MVTISAPIVRPKPQKPQKPQTLNPHSSCLSLFLSSRVASAELWGRVLGLRVAARVEGLEGSKFCLPLGSHGLICEGSWAQRPYYIRLLGYVETYSVRV